MHFRNINKKNIKNIKKLYSMRQIVLVFVAFFFFGQAVFAQSEAKTRQLRNNIAKSDANIQHPKRSLKIKTWLTRGKLHHDAYNLNLGTREVRWGMSISDVDMIFKGAPVEVSETPEGLVVQTFNQIRFDFLNGYLRSWEDLDPVVPNALPEAIKAYQKARTLDAKGRNEKRILEVYEMINSDLEGKFFNEFYKNQYVNAFNTALLRVDFNNYRGFADTTYYFYAGFVAFAQSQIDSSMWRQSIQNLERALQLGFVEFAESKGQIYNLLFTSYISVGDSATALRYAQTGFEKHPESTALMYDLINFYLHKAEHSQALEYLEQAVARSPQDPILLFAKGKVLDELGKIEESIASYNASIAIDPEYFDPVFNKAVVYFNEGVRLNDVANETKTNAEYDRYKDLSDIEFEKALEPMLRAYELRPNDTSVIETLRTIYLRLRTKYPEFEEKYEEMARRYNELQGGQ